MRRLSPGTLIVGMFAILLGLLGAYAVRGFVGRETPPPPAPLPDPLMTVPLASMDLPAGRTVTQGDVMSMQMTLEQVREAEFPPAWMERVPQILGRTLREPLDQGRPFEPQLFYPEGMGPGVAERLQPGERAVTLPLRREAVDGTFITPGTIVDVLFRSDPQEGLEIPDATVTLLSQVKVLAVGRATVEGMIGQEADPGAPGETQTVTLAVNDTQARALKVVEGRGSLSMVIRGPDDSDVAEAAGPTTLQGLLGLKEVPAPFVSEIYRRGRLATLVFEDGQRQKMTLDPPYGLPVDRDPQEVPDTGLDVWFPRSRTGGYPRPYRHDSYRGW